MTLYSRLWQNIKVNRSKTKFFYLKLSTRVVGILVAAPSMSSVETLKQNKRRFESRLAMDVLKSQES